MSDNAARQLFLEYFRCQELLHDVLGWLPVVFRPYRGEGTPTELKAEPMIQSIMKKASLLSINQRRLARLLSNQINAFMLGKRPTKTLEKFLVAHHDHIKKEIRDIPNTVQKARQSLLALIDVDGFRDCPQVYDAMVLLHERLPSGLPRRIVRDWKSAARKHEAKRRAALHLWSQVFWLSRDLMENQDSVSRYRFREHFRIGGFDAAFAEVERNLADELMEWSLGLPSETAGVSADTLSRVAYQLWLMSRSRTLANRLHQYIDIALSRILATQSPAGAWGDVEIVSTDYHGLKGSYAGHRFLPDTYTTALCCVSLLKLSTSETMRQRGVLAAIWLLAQQNSDGSWHSEGISNEGLERNPDLFASLLSLEALLRSRLPDIGHSVELGIRWLQQQQHQLGMWEDEGMPFPFLTVLVLELMDSKASLLKEPDVYGSMSRHFLNKSVRLSLEDSHNSRRLAVITAYQGIEALLYSLLSHPAVNIKIFETSKETVGMKKALTRFQGHLQDQKNLKRNETLSYRNSLDRLAYLRDEVVHKGADVGKATCRELIDHAQRFASQYSLEILGFDILA